MLLYSFSTQITLIFLGKLTHNALQVSGEQKLVAACIAEIQFTEVSCLLNTSQVVEGCGKRSKAKPGSLVENNLGSDWKRTVTGKDLSHAHAGYSAILCSVSTFISYSLTCAEPQEERALY